MVPVMTVEDVVEVVRDAAGELAHGLHLLGLAELSLGFLHRASCRDRPRPRR